MAQEIKLLSTYDGFPPQSIITVSDSIAAQLLPLNATTDLSGGVRRYKEIAPVGAIPFPPAPGPGSVGANQRTTITLPGDYQLNLSGNSSAQGTFAVLDTSGAELSTGVLAPGAATIGPFNDARQVRLIGQAGSVNFSAEFQAFGAGTVAEVVKVGVASGVVSHRPNGGIVSSSTTQPANQTYSSIISCPKDFMGVRILFENYDTAASKTIKAKAAPTATITAGGSTLAFLPVTFNGADTVTLPPATSIRGLTVYSQITPSYAWSDVIPIQSIPRTDVIGGDRLIYLRTYSAEALTPKVLYVTENSIINQGWLDTGDYVASTSVVGDFVTNTATNITPTIYKAGDATVPAYSGAFMPYGQIDFYTGGKTARILAVGDSQTEGSPNNTISWPMATRKVFRQLGHPNVQIANAACSGQKRDVTSSIFQSMAAKTKPDVAIFWNESVNSGGDFPTGQQFKFLASDIEFCRANGIKPVVVTQHLATNSTTGKAETNRTRAFLEGTGVTLLDFAAVLATSPTNAAVNPEYVTDGRHHSASGVAVLAQYAAPILLELL